MAIIKHRYDDYDSEYIKIADYIVNFKSQIFDMQRAYFRMHEWFVEEGYTTGEDPDFPEVFFLEKEGKAGKEMWIRWRFTKNPMGGKMSSFWRYDFDVDIMVLTLTKVETIINNKKVQIDKGEVEIKVKTNLILNWAKKIKKSSLLKPFREVIYRSFLHNTRKRLEQELYDQSYDFRNAVALYFGQPHYEAKKGGLEFWQRRLPE